jgi:hypothetical protein
MDRFQQPDFEPETPEKREAANIAYWELRKAAERRAAEENQKKLEQAAEKAKRTGDRKDLREYLKLRRQLL